MIKDSLRLARGAALVVVALLAAGCATAPARTSTEDSLEAFNRKVHAFNDAVDRAALRPVAEGYRKITPSPVRSGVSNFFGNASYPITIINQFLQGKFADGGRDTCRFLVNTTLGLAGLIDVASRINLPANDEDFGQTLAVWGVPSGPYLVIPFLGPSTVRDGLGRVPEFYASGLDYLEYSWSDYAWEAEWGARGLDVVSSRAELLSVDQTLERAYDSYAFMRDAWIQRRDYVVFDGDPPLDDLIPEDLEDPAPEEDAAEKVPADAL